MDEPYKYTGPGWRVTCWPFVWLIEDLVGERMTDALDATFPSPED